MRAPCYSQLIPADQKQQRTCWRRTIAAHEDCSTYRVACYSQIFSSPQITLQNVTSIFVTPKYIQKIPKSLAFIINQMNTSITFQGSPYQAALRLQQDPDFILASLPAFFKLLRLLPSNARLVIKEERTYKRIHEILDSKLPGVGLILVAKLYQRVQRVDWLEPQIKLILTQCVETIKKIDKKVKGSVPFVSAALQSLINIYTALSGNLEEYNLIHKEALHKIPDIVKLILAKSSILIEGQGNSSASDSLFALCLRVLCTLLTHFPSSVKKQIRKVLGTSRPYLFQLGSFSQRQAIAIEVKSHNLKGNELNFNSNLSHWVNELNSYARNNLLEIQGSLEIKDPLNRASHKVLIMSQIILRILNEPQTGSAEISLFQWLEILEKLFHDIHAQGSALALIVQREVATILTSLI